MSVMSLRMSLRFLRWLGNIDSTESILTEVRPGGLLLPWGLAWLLLSSKWSGSMAPSYGGLSVGSIVGGVALSRLLSPLGELVEVIAFQSTGGSPAARWISGENAPVSEQRQKEWRAAANQIVAEEMEPEDVVGELRGCLEEDGVLATRWDEYLDYLTARNGVAACALGVLLSVVSSTLVYGISYQLCAVGLVLAAGYLVLTVFCCRLMARRARTDARKLLDSAREAVR